MENYLEHIENLKITNIFKGLKNQFIKKLNKNKKRTNKKGLSKDQINEILNLYSKGHSCHEIHKITGYNHHTVLKYVKKKQS